ncbi:MAG: bifunctional demethylmenaquinone methyltransferase/2-methoxy-6-polyprenyl-1,4-benzoquinol methylase UbiE [Bacteroidota bacterium]|nr:bifunctional demethylmenaquinone methyltransferase/2-methoxy-6-polyprenyl-1,4-benzoquinol methylase UbiE [Bacteroidota bacterium]
MRATPYKGNAVFYGNFGETTVLASTINKDHTKVVPDSRSTAQKKVQVEEMFDNISGKYDFLNRVLSLGIDKGWRKKVIEALAPTNPQRILDIATGTGDLAIDLAKLNPISITGIDISEQMLAVGRIKVLSAHLENLIKLERADSENLHYAEGSFDTVTVSFGVRNFEDLNVGLGEIYRVLEKDGTIAILEFSQPPGKFFRRLYYLYLQYVLPTIGKVLSQDNRAYAYLAESVRAFPSGKKFIEHMGSAGFINTRFIELTWGICTLYIGKK